LGKFLRVLGFVRKEQITLKRLSFGYQICSKPRIQPYRREYDFEAVISFPFQEPKLECAYVVQIQLCSSLRQNERKTTTTTTIAYLHDFDSALISFKDKKSAFLSVIRRLAISTTARLQSDEK